MNKTEKANIGRKLADMLRLSYDPSTKGKARRYIVAYRADGTGPQNSRVTVEQLYDIVHGVVCRMAYNNAIRDAVKALEGLLPEGEAKRKKSVTKP